MIWLVLLVLVVALFALASRAREPTGSNNGQAKPRSFTIREGKAVPTDAAFDAWTSADLQKMLKALGTRTNKIDRHFLLQGIVQQCYKARSDPKLRAKCLEIGRLHLEEFPSIAPALKRDMGGTLPRVSTFQHLSTVLTEDGEYEKAIEVCEIAKRFGLHDGTKSGFDGRIARIRKKQQS